MAIEGGYAPPGVYTQTIFEDTNTNVAQLQGRVPLLIGVGRQTVESKGNALVRGSSSTIDQRIVEEDPTGRMISDVNPDGSYVLANYDGVLTEIAVRHFPIVIGDGTGTSSRSPSSVVATINGNATVVLEVDGENGKIRLAEAPSQGDDVRISYFFNRTDTLISDENLSSQVSSFQTEILGSAGSLVITEANNVFIVTCDNETAVITLGVEANRADSLNKILNAINGAGVGSLEADSYTDQNGSENIILTANGYIEIGAGTANTALGFYTGQKGTTRTSTFFTAYKPIVDGTNGGVTATDTTLITVKVDGQVVPAQILDGANGSFTLPTPPKVGSTLSVTYYHNTFKDQFDYIPGRDVKSIDRVSLVASGGGASAQYIQDVDFVLHDDKIVWGTASLVSTGATQEGTISFGGSQVSATLRDERGYLLECTPVTNTSVIPPRVLKNVFKLPYQPVDGTGTGTPTSNPALVIIRTGASFADALENPLATVISVDPVTSQVTLATAPPTNHKVFATFYYSILQDRFDLNAYNVTVDSVGASSIGTYSITAGNTSFYGSELTAKGVDLSLVAVQFPSGSENDHSITMGTGVPVEEEITLQFENFEATPASFFATGSAPYYLVQNFARLNMTLNANNVVVDFDAPTGQSKGHITHFVGEVLPYAPESDNSNLGTNISTSITLEVDGVSLPAATVNGASKTVEDLVLEINTQASATSPIYTAMSVMGAWSAIDDSAGADVANSYRSFSFSYTGDSTASTTVTCTIAEADYLTADALAGDSTILGDGASTGINLALEQGIAASALAGLEITCSTNAGRLVFSLNSLANADSDFGYVEFTGADETSFLSVAGIDFSANAGETQTKWGYLPVASQASIDLLGNGIVSEPHRDRLILKSRTLIGDRYYPPVDLGISVITGTNLDLMGIPSSLNLTSSRTSVLDNPNLVLNVGWDEVDDAKGIPAKTMYDGTGAGNQNDTLLFTFNGTSVSITFTSSGGGTILDISEMVAELNGDATFSTHANAYVEGQNIRIVSKYNDSNSYLRVGAGVGNSAFGLIEGTTISTRGITAEALSSALMSHHSVVLKDFLFSTDVTDGDVVKYAPNAVSYVYTDAVGKKYLGFESLSVGVSSVIAFNGDEALNKGTGLKIIAGEGSVGEAYHQGFFLTSNNPNGTGSANTSTLNDGVGADGRVGQTYVDSVTGFSITVLPRDGGIDYPTGSDATMSFNVSRVIKTNANIPMSVIPGVSLIVSNTLDTAIGDNALVETFNKGGREPTIGQTYYIDFTRDRSSFNTRTFSNLADIIRTYGPISIENSLSMGAYLAFSNGATALACKQIQLDTDQTSPTEDQMIQALQDIEGEIVPGLTPSVLMPLVPASIGLLSAISNHCDVQSSIRYRSERRAVLGCAVGTQPRDAQALAQATGNTRVCLIYPDMARINFVDSEGVRQNFLVGGEYLACAVAMATSNPNLDSATPWTNRVINGFTSLGRTLDDVDANATANAGVTVLKQTVQGIQVRHGLTTDMTSVLTKTPTVIQIADDVHLRCRNLVSAYIGTKFVPNTISQIQGRVNNLFKQLVRDQIISTYTGLSVTTDPNDPTGLLVDVFYKPVYPLLYIQFTFRVQGS